MPELPEVETIKLGLQKRIIGLKIQKIQILSPKSFIGNPNLAQGKNVLKVWRKAKLLGIDLADQSTANRLPTTAKSGRRKTEDGRQLTLLFHLKMSGQLIYIQNDKRLTINDKRFIGGHPTEDMQGKMPNVHTRVIFSFSDGSSYVLPKAKGKVPQGRAKIPHSEARSGFLYFNDQRKFGWVRVMEGTGYRLQVTGLLKDLGPEPLEKEFTWEILKSNLIKHKSQPVKVAIMDQTVVSGVGNIYSNEACFDAKIDPRKKVSELSDQEFRSLHRGVIKSLRDGIKHGGSTRVHFVDSEGHKGYFLDYAFVYWRDKHPCKVCGTEIKKISLAGRGTYLCPHCQT